MENPAPLTCALPERVATVGEGIKDSLPIVISYLPVAFAFGLNATRLGFTPLESLFFSCIIYAGASQFVITAMLAAGSSLWVAALTVMAMDVRHVLYGPSLRSRIRSALDKKKTALWAFGLTDEVFAAATARLVRDNRRWSENWMLGLAFTSWASWVCGTLAGAWSGNGLLVDYPAVEAALGFMLPALFMSFLLASFQRQQSLCVTAALAGALGGILVEDPDEENTPFALSELPAVDLHEMSNAPQGDLGSAMIYYAFDNTVNSSRYPYYSYMKGFWTAMGLHTRIDTTVTVSDLKRMNDYGLCILSAHGSYYTYTSGFLFKQTRTEPVILLTEESDFYKDLYYGIDLLTHRVIKINGLYCITPSFFRAAYRGGQLKDTVVLSETCEFLGVSGSLDTSMADALLAGGAKAVAGYVNNVYTVYSRSMLWDTVNHLILGQTLQESVQHSMDTYGADDLVWYNAQGGKRPHAAAAYPLLFGDVGVRLIEPNAAPAPQEVQQAA